MLVWKVDRWIIENLKRHFKIEQFDPLKSEFPKILILGTYDIGTFSEVGGVMETIWWLSKIKGIKKILFLSNYGVYKPSDSPVNENHSKGPKNFSGAVANTLEDFIEFISEKNGMCNIVLRLFNIYGPFQDRGYIVADIIEEVLKSNSDTIRVGDQKKVRDFLYIEDFISALKVLIESCEKPFEVYNVASGKGITIREIINKILKISARTNVDIIFDPLKIRDEYDYDYVVADVSKLRSKGWEPKFSIDEGLKLTYYWYLAKR